MLVRAFSYVLVRAFSYVTAAFGRACCVVISREIRQIDVKYITWGVTYFAHARWKIKRLLAVVSLSGSIGETNCSQGTIITVLELKYLLILKGKGTV